MTKPLRRAYGWIAPILGALSAAGPWAAAQNVVPRDVASPAPDQSVGGEPRFNVAVTDAPAQAFFQGLADGTPYNILVDPEVAGTVTLSLKQVTIEQALEAARDLYGFDYRRTSSGFLVLPATVQSRVWRLSYLNLQRYGVSKTRISSGQVTQGDENAQYSNGIATLAGAPGAAGVPGAAGGGAIDQSGRPVSDLSGTAVVTRADSDFWGSLTISLKAIVGTQPNHSLVINRESGVIWVRAMPRELDEVDEYLRRISAVMTRQVIIEAKIVEVELDNAYQAGIDWASVLTSGNKSYFIGQSSPPNGFAGNPLTPQANPVTVGPGQTVSSLIAPQLGGAFTFAANFSNFNTFIQLLASEGKTHVLSSPRVSTLNNQKAIIKAGSDEFFVTGVSSNTVTGTAVSTTSNVQLTPFFSGVALDVTPEIGDDGRVLLHIHPTVSAVTDEIKTVTIAGSTTTMPLALSQIRESDDVVEARSGQLIVIGGLMRQSRQEQNYRTPILGDIPLLGKLFRSEQKQSASDELVILLRPLVVSDADWPALSAEPRNHPDTPDIH